MHRIVFTGAQSTGKTTILKKMEEMGCNVITEVVRKLAESGVKINKDGDEKSQVKIFKEYERLLSEMTMTGYISDRCLIDVVAYTMHLAKHGKIEEKFLDKQLKALKKFVASNPDITYCYFPIEFGVVEDDVRDTDEEYRKEIDNNIRYLMELCGLQPIYIRGSVEYRTSKVCRIYNWLNEGVRLYTSDVESAEEGTSDVDAPDVEPTEEGSDSEEE